MRMARKKKKVKNVNTIPFCNSTAFSFTIHQLVVIKAVCMCLLLFTKAAINMKRVSISVTRDTGFF